MTQTINIKTIIIAYIAAAIIVLAASVMHTSHTAAPVNWQADSSWVKSWKF